MRISTFNVVVLLLFFVAGRGEAANLDFKGLMLDGEVTTAQVEENLRTPCQQTDKPCDEFWQGIHDKMSVSCGDGVGGVKVCNGMTTVAGERAEANVVIGSSGHLQRIFLTLDSDAFDAIADELIKKFGRPSSTKRSVVQNGFGARYLQVEHVWHGANGSSVLLSKYATSVDKSTLYFSTKADNEMLSDSKKGRSDDL